MINKNFPSYDKLNKLVLKKNAKWIEHHAGKEFGKFIDNLPWKENRIDFDALDRDLIKIDLWSSTKDEMHEFIESTSVSVHSKVAFLILDDAPLLVTDVNNIKTKLADFLYEGGDALLFAYDDLNAPCFSDFITVNNWKAVGFKKTTTRRTEGQVFLCHI